MESDPRKQARQGIAMMDAELVAMDAQLGVVRRHLASLHGTDAEKIALELKPHVEKVEAMRERRALMVKRVERIERIAEITETMRGMRVELEAMIARGEGGPRFEELRAKALALGEEARNLKAPT